jgi:hypothetical protein
VEPATTGPQLADITNAINTTATANNSLLSHAGPEGCPRMASYSLPPPKVLIANRGEIARRVIKSCALHGVDTIAVYTEVDALAPHVREATQAVFLGKNPRDYTNHAKLLKVGGVGVDGDLYKIPAPLVDVYQILPAATAWPQCALPTGSESWLYASTVSCMQVVVDGRDGCCGC